MNESISSMYEFSKEALVECSGAELNRIVNGSSDPVLKLLIEDPDCYKEYNIITISVNNAEADDIIKLMVDKYKNETIYIVTNDRDLYQLLLVKMDLTIVSYSGITKVEKICKFLKDIYDKYVNATEKDIYIIENYGEYSKNILNLKYTPKEIEECFFRVMSNINLLC